MRIMIEDIRETLRVVSTVDLLAREERVGDNPYSCTSEVVIEYYNCIIEELNSRGVYLELLDK